jgi:hypothetical protein
MITRTVARSEVAMCVVVVAIAEIRFGEDERGYYFKGEGFRFRHDGVEGPRSNKQRRRDVSVLRAD